ncbi:MAG: hypothetical protein PVI90_09740, partial [Desulfobacteraceae bacterium]
MKAFFLMAKVVLIFVFLITGFLSVTGCDAPHNPRGCDSSDAPSTDTDETTVTDTSDATDETTSSDDQTSDEQATNDQTSDEQTTDDQTGDEQTTDDQTGDEQTTDDQTGDEQTTDDQTDDEQATDDQTAEAVDWSNYTQLDGDMLSTPEIENPDFNQGVDGWSLADGYSYSEDGGREETGGLRYDRQDASVYKLAVAQVELSPNVHYKFGAWIKTENVEGHATGATVCLEFIENGSWYGGKYTQGITGTTDWTLVEGEGFTPTVPVKVNIVLYLSQGATGTVWFDDVFIKPCASEWNAYPISPRRTSWDTEPKQIELASFLLGNMGDGTQWADPDSMVCRMQLHDANGIVQDIVVPVEGERIYGDLESLAPGDYTFKAILADPEHQWILAETQWPVSVLSSADESLEPTNAVRVDEQGRTWVDGELFLPVGLYFGVIQREDLEQLEGTAFNTILSYDSLNMKFYDTSKDGIEATKEVMDAFHDQGIKTIFSLKDVFEELPNNKPASWNGETTADGIVTKAVQAFSDHPALLAWYICDELSAEHADALINRNMLVNNLDPYHPTWAVFYQFSDLPLYRNGFDLLGVDAYPIVNDNSDSMEIIDEAMYHSQRAIGSKQGMSLWTVPQIFNWGVYKAGNDPETYSTKYRYPTEEEMRSMALYMALRGSKGFIFYSFFDLLQGPDEDQFETRWPEVCRVGTMVSELAPFLLSDADAPSVTVTVHEGNVEAQA